MKILAIIGYAIGSILLVISCFTTSETATWWLGGIALVCLIGGCVCQYNVNKNKSYVHHSRRY